MSAAAAETVVQWGVRYRWPGDPDFTVAPALDLRDALDKVEDLADHGVARLAVVTREVPAWSVARDGLPDVLRALADAHVDDEVTFDIVSEHLAELLDVELEVTAEAIAVAWRDVLEAIDQYRKADDGLIDWAMVEPELRDPELYVRRLDEGVAEAIDKVIRAAR